MNILRRGTIKWPGRAECFKKSRKKVFVRMSKKGTRITKYYWQCAKCLEWKRNEKDFEVDHIIEIGPYEGDWNEYILRVFCRQSNLQLLCTTCHLKKTMVFNSARTRWKRKIKI